MTENSTTNTEQVTRFHLELVELIKKYQFRDREQVVCHGISVSQCYILETLHTFGELTAGELAHKMHLSVSTITRVFDQLAKKNLVKRSKSPHDKRVHLCQLTSAGEDMYQKIWAKVFLSEKNILENFKTEHRELLISFLNLLNKSLKLKQE